MWDVAGLLLDHNADVNLSDRENNTVLHLTAASAPHDMLQRLITKENINVQNWLGQTALAMILSHCLPQAILAAQSLLDHGADCNLRTTSHQTPIDIYVLDKTLNNICHPLFAKLIRKSHLAGYISICHVILYQLGRHLDMLIELDNLMFMVRLLPSFHLETLYIRHICFSDVHVFINQHACPIPVRIEDSAADVITLLLLETSTICSHIAFTFAHRPQDRRAVKMVQQLKGLKQHLQQAGSQPCSLHKLCILGIRGSMPSKGQDAYDQLPLPPKLSAMVTFEHVAKKLVEMMK
jgi:hypothetical protein